MYKIKFKNGNVKEFETLRWADLRGADLSGADLRGANLCRADLSDAYLNGADLRGADLFDTNVMTFQLGRHFAFFHEGYLKIGCQGHSLEHWLTHFKTIGKQFGCTEQEIERYKVFINALAVISYKESK